MIKPKILVVEDEAIVARDIVMQLVELGYEPIGPVRCGEQAITMAEELRPNLVLMDIQLAGAMDGIEAAQAIHTLFNLPVVFLTAYAAEDTIARAKLTEPFGYILKPFSERELQVVIEMALYKHQTETRLRTSEAFNRSILDSVSAEIAVLDREGFIIAVNAAWRDYSLTNSSVPGVPTPQTEIGTNYLSVCQACIDLNADQDAIKALDGIRAVLDGRLRSFSLEYPCDSPQYQGWFAMQVTPLDEHLQGVVVSHTDITMSKQTDTALRKSEALQRAILDASPDLLFVLGLDGYYYSYHSNRDDLLVSPPEGLLGKRVSQVLPSAAAETVLKALQQAYETGFSNGLTFSLELAQGTRWFELSVARKARPSNEEPRFVVISRDITERKQAADLQEQLNHAQKMSSLGRLAGGMAHDFNNMLSVILGYGNMVLEATDPAHAHFAYLEQICNAGQRAADLTRQLLAFARKQPVMPKVLDLNAAVLSGLEMLKRLIGENIQFDCQLEADLWHVMIDPSQLDQILTNLCINARDAIGNVGRITLVTKNQTFSAADCRDYSDQLPGEYVLLAVSDTGCGIDAETQTQIFEPFFTTKPIGQGTGLGLASVYGAVTQNKGFICVSSELGQGTRFSIYLPRHLGSPELEADAVARAKICLNETILLVEDEPALLDMATLMLEDQGYTVLAASSPSEAIRQAREYVGQIHLLVTDVIMPEMNGLDLIKTLLCDHPHLKYLLMSGYLAKHIPELLEDGMHFIQKPFTPKSLAAKVRTVLDQIQEN